MRKTALLTDRRYVDHAVLPDNPERPERLEVLLALADDPGREGIVAVEPRAATREEIVAVHTPEHFERVADSAGKEWTTYDYDTAASANTYEVALLAAGGLLAVLDAIEDGRADNAFALIRPPGHHAESDRIMGFCFFNNVAVGAEYLRRRHGREKVLVLDWDVTTATAPRRSSGTSPACCTCRSTSTRSIRAPAPTTRRAARKLRAPR